MLKEITLLVLIVFTLSSQPVCATGPFPIIGLHGAEEGRALAAKATAELAAGERIERWVRSEAIERILWDTVSIEKANSYNWRQKQSMEVFGRNLLRPMTLLEHDDIHE